MGSRTPGLTERQRRKFEGEGVSLRGRGFFELWHGLAVVAMMNTVRLLERSATAG